MVASRVSTSARHCQQASRWVRTWRDLRPESSPSRWRSSKSSSGWRTERLLIAHLLQPHHGAAQEFPDRGSADPQRRSDLRVTQTFHPQKQAAALLLAQPLDGAVKAQHALAFDQVALGCIAVRGIARAQFRIEGLLA